MSLRQKFSLVIVGISVVALVAVNFLTYFSLESFLNGQVDADLEVAASQAQSYLIYSYVNHKALNPNRLDNILSPTIYIEILGKHNEIIFRRPSGSQSFPDPQPNLPSSMPISPMPPKLAIEARRGHILTPNAASFEMNASGKSGLIYRAEALLEPNNETLVVAEGLSDVKSTLHRLLLIESLSTGFIVLLLGGIGYLLAFRGLRPLNEMADTADKIAAGDLGRRVETSSGASEIVRLKVAFNKMLEEIEFAFKGKMDSEDKLKRFIADASHELRTPLTSIRGYSELYLKGAIKGEDQVDRSMAKINQEAKRMSSMVDDLFLLTRLDAGREIEFSKVDLVGIVKQVIEQVRLVNPKRQLDVQLPTKLFILGESDRLKQVLLNLINNAIVYTDENVPIHIRVKNEENAIVEIEDEGDGINDEDKSRVFERFYRVPMRSSKLKSQDTNISEGIGLGLAIVKGIVEAHSGHVYVEDGKKGGALFIVKLPISSDGSLRSSSL